MGFAAQFWGLMVEGEGMSIKSVWRGGGGGGKDGMGGSGWECGPEDVGGGGGCRFGWGGTLVEGSYCWGDGTRYSVGSPSLVSSASWYVGGGESRDSWMGLGGC